jgi:hypothetical protein
MQLADLVALLAGGVLSLALAYFPWVATWYAKFDPPHKQFINLVCLLFVSLALFGLSCLGWLAGLGLPSITCDQAGALGLARAFILALVGSSGTYTATKYLHKGA